MVMIRPPACHFWKFLMKNMIPTNSGLSIRPVSSVVIALNGVITMIIYVCDKTCDLCS